MNKPSTKVIRPAAGTAAVVALLTLALPGRHNASGAARPASGDPAAGPPDSMLVRTPAGASVNRVEAPEPAGVIQLFRVVAPAGTRVTVTGVISGLAGVSISLPLTRRDNAETCAPSGRSVVCSQAEEACPMPPATWQFRVRKSAGPAGRIRIDFVVGSEHSV